MNLDSIRDEKTQHERWSQVHGLILDMDGVLWRGDEAIGDLPAIFERMAHKGLKVVLATNNATRSVEQYLDKLQGFGLSLEPWQIVNSAQAVAHYMHQRFPAGGPIFLVGEDGIRLALREQGFYEDDIAPLAVIAGMDRAMTYEKLSTAALLIRAGALFVGTNPDRTFPTPRGLVPGAGAILALLEAATDQKALIVGKPGPEMYRVSMERLGLPLDSVLAVGDRLETDILGGQELGCPTALVLSGVTSPERAQAWSPRPDIIAPDLTALVEML